MYKYIIENLARIGGDNKKAIAFEMKERIHIPKQSK